MKARWTILAVFALGTSLAGSASAAIACYTYHVTQGATGAEKCGVKCSDNTYYGMACDADIFNDGFDIEYTEGIAPGGGSGTSGTDHVIEVAQEMGVEISPSQANNIKLEVLRRQDAPFADPASDSLTVPMLRRLGIQFDEQAVEAAAPASE